MPTKIVVMPEKVASLAKMVNSEESDFTERYFGALAFYEWAHRSIEDPVVCEETCFEFLGDNSPQRIALKELELCLRRATAGMPNKQAFLRAITLLWCHCIDFGVEEAFPYVRVDLSHWEVEAAEILALAGSGNPSPVFLTDLNDHSSPRVIIELLMRYYSDVPRWDYVITQYIEDVSKYAQAHTSDFCLPKSVVETMWQD